MQYYVVIFVGIHGEICVLVWFNSYVSEGCSGHAACERSVEMVYSTVIHKWRGRSCGLFFQAAVRGHLCRSIFPGPCRRREVSSGAGICERGAF